MSLLYSFSSQPLTRGPGDSAGREATQSRAWIRAHEELSRLAKCRAQLEWEEGRGLLAAFRAGVHRYLGFGSFFEYVEGLFGYKARSVEEKLRVAEALEVLPILSQELRQGTLSWSAVRELTRVATADTEQAWREVAQGKTVRQVEERVSGRKPGDTPASAADPALRRHVFSFEVRAETFATFREALAKVRRDAGGPLDEESALLLMARQVLSGPTDTGRASYQIALTRCERCGRAIQQGCGDTFEVDSSLAQMAACDAQYLPDISPSTRDVATSPRAAAQVRGESGGQGSARRAGAAADECAHVGVDATLGGNGHGGARRAGATTKPGAHVGVDATLGGDGHGGARRAGGRPDERVQVGGARLETDGQGSARGSRATQSIPPRVRRFVLRRDGGRCVVPGCRHAVFVDVHHLEMREEGGGHDPQSLVVLCAAHHRAVHRGSLLAEGTTARGLVFRHADGTRYRDMASAAVVAAQTQAFSALKNLGFREGEVRRALAQLETSGSLVRANAESVVRAALQVLTARAT